MVSVAPSSTSNRVHCLGALIVILMMMPSKAAIRNRRLDDDDGGNLSPFNDDETALNIYLALTNPDNGEAYDLDYLKEHLGPYVFIHENPDEEETETYIADIYTFEYIPRSETNDGDTYMLPLCVQKKTCYSLTVGVYGDSLEKRYIVPDGQIKFEYDGNIVPWSETSPYPFLTGPKSTQMLVVTFSVTLKHKYYSKSRLPPVSDLHISTGMSWTLLLRPVKRLSNAFHQQRNGGTV